MIYIYYKEVNNAKPSLENDIETLQNNMPITPEYWLKYARAGETCRGDYVGSLIHNMAECLRNISNR